jgi:hypothetical protein
MEQQLAFCPSCGAPQIRVSRPEEAQPATELQEPSVSGSQSHPVVLIAPPADLHGMTGIQWKPFLRTAAPLAALTGAFTAALPPLGLFVLLPSSLVWAISRYRRQRPFALHAGQGVRMGALMGLLSFGFFLVMIFLNPSAYRDIMVRSIHESALRNPDPQVQQMLQWFTTPDGLVACAAMFLAVLLGFFVVIGMGSGALAAALGKERNQPPL